jgi:transposase-like protein
MRVNLKKIQRKRVFSDELKRKIVKEFEKGEITIKEISNFYQVNVSAIYKWIYKYSRYQKKSIQIVEMTKSSTQKIKDLEFRIKDLERAVGQKQMNIDFLEKMIDIAKDEYDIDIKKNSSTPQSTGFESTKKN